MLFAHLRRSFNAIKPDNSRCNASHIMGSKSGKQCSGILRELSIDAGTHANRIRRRRALIAGSIKIPPLPKRCSKFQTLKQDAGG